MVYFHELDNADNRVWVNFTTVVDLTTGKRYLTKMDADTAVVAAHEYFVNGVVVDTAVDLTAHALFDSTVSSYSCGNYAALKPTAKQRAIEKTNPLNLVLV